MIFNVLKNRTNCSIRYQRFFWYSQCCDSMFREENAMECHPIVENGNEAICQEYVRSAIGLKPGCVLGPREQMNFATAFLDGSGIYGSTPKSSEDLRLLKG